MKVLKYVLIALTILNLPSVFFFYISPSMGSLLSYLTYALLIVYYFLNKRGKPNMWLLAIGFSFFLIAGLNFHSGDLREYYISFIKYIIIITCGSTLVKKITVNELTLFLFLGAITPILHSVLFPDRYGRYSGFYINPNSAGFIAIIAFTFTFHIKKKIIKNIAQILITIGGIVTFSRTFIIIWVLTNLISIKIDVKNIRLLAAGFGLLVGLTLFGSIFKLNTVRLKQLSAVLNKEKGAVKGANEDSRTETWAYYYDYIIEKPILGNGYNAFQSTGYFNVGVHNSYLLIIGEAGIIPFLLFTSLFIYLIIKGIKLFKEAPFLLMQALALTFFLLTFHNFFISDNMLIIILWMLYQIKKITQNKASKEVIIKKQ